MTAVRRNVLPLPVRSPKMSVGHLDDSLAAFVRLPHDYKVVGGLDRQRPEEHGVHGAENGALAPMATAKDRTAVAT